MIQRFADLHLHTYYSDGTYSPSELVKLSKKKGLSCIAIADHDTVDAIEESIEAGVAEGIEVIPAIELTADTQGTEVHFLGYFVDYQDDQFKEKLKSIREFRVERIRRIVEKLNKEGIALRAESVFELSGAGTIGRLHIARAMVREKLVSSTGEAFQRYIGDNCPAYVSGFKFSPKEAVEIIKSVGGIPVLAHPYILKNDELLDEFVRYGLKGLEVYYPEHTQSMINFYLDFAKKNGLLITGGSDCHGKAKPEAKIGMIKLPYEFVEKLKEARGNK